LIATYETDLEEQYRNESTKVSELIRAIHEEFKNNYSKLQERLDEAHKEDQAIVVSMGNITLHQVKVSELTKILQEDQNKIAFLGKDLERAKEALLSGNQEIEEMVWIFKEQNKIKDDGRRVEVSNRDIFMVENRIRELEANYRRLEQIYGAGNKELKGLTQEIQTWQDSLNKLMAAGDSENRTNIEPREILQRHIRSLEQQIFDLQSSIEINQRALIEHSTEAGRIASVQRKIENINTQMNDVRDFVRIAEKKLFEIGPGESKTSQEGFRFQKLQNATYGEEVWPILLVILGIGGLLGSLIGFGLGCLVELADKTFHNPDEVMKKLNVSLMGHVPVIAQNKRYLVENSSIDPVVCTYHRPKSQVAEAFRAVRTSLYFNTQGKNHSVIQITSPTPGDGKSTLASNLAVSIAQSGKRVLLIDADMRRPRQHTTFGIESSRGFATVLSGQSEWRESLTESVEIDGLSIMPCGNRPNNPAELSSSPQIDFLLKEMREEFDFVIIDTPPLLAVTDPTPIAARVDGVVLCLRIKKNVRVSAERANEILTNLGAHCIGLVINGVGAQSGYGSQYTYGAYRAGYSYNGYGYGYGTGGEKYYDEDKKGRRYEPKTTQLQRIESADQTGV
jgi:capsular exopolysaccharide synthesis family protein